MEASLQQRLEAPERITPELQRHLSSDVDQLREALDQKVEERLQTIDIDLEREPERILRTFALQTHRVEPAGAIYLWPQGVR